MLGLDQAFRNIAIAVVVVIVIAFVAGALVF